MLTYVRPLRISAISEFSLRIEREDRVDYGRVNMLPCSMLMNNVGMGVDERNQQHPARYPRQERIADPSGGIFEHWGKSYHSSRNSAITAPLRCSTIDVIAPPAAVNSDAGLSVRPSSGASSETHSGKVSRRLFSHSR
jgi:hypothetical protein